MGQRYLMDTNVIIGVLKGAIARPNALKLSKIIDKEFIVSTIVNIETLGYHAITPTDLIQSERLLSKAKVIYVDKIIEEKAIEIRQKKKMKLVIQLLQQRH